MAGPLSSLFASTSLTTFSPTNGPRGRWRAGAGGGQAFPVMAMVGSTPGGVATLNGLTYDLSSLGLSSRSVGVTSPLPSGKWYWEMKAGTSALYIGLVSDISASMPNSLGSSTVNAGWNIGTPWNQWGSVGAGTTWTGTDRLGLAYDTTAKTFSLYKNNVLVETMTLTSAPATLYFAVCTSGGSIGTATAYFQGGCLYSPPSGYSYL